MVVNSLAMLTFANNLCLRARAVPDHGILIEQSESTVGLHNTFYINDL